MKNEVRVYINKMIEEFNSMDKYPIIEYEYEPDEYDVYNLFVTPYGIQTREANILIEWDYCLTLDEHLQVMYDEIVNKYI